VDAAHNAASTESKDPEDAGHYQKRGKAISPFTKRTGEDSLNPDCWNWHIRDPSTALSSLRDDNSAQDDSSGLEPAGYFAAQQQGKSAAG
jgi:hypothetical protein